jgi:hypothetical protein
MCRVERARTAGDPILEAWVRVVSQHIKQMRLLAHCYRLRVPSEMLWTAGRERHLLQLVQQEGKDSALAAGTLLLCLISKEIYLLSVFTTDLHASYPNVARLYAVQQLNALGLSPTDHTPLPTQTNDNKF